MFNIYIRLMFFVSSPDMSVLLGRVDQESSHNTSVVTSHVDHVVGLSVLHISQVQSPLLLLTFKVKFECSQHIWNPKQIDIKKKLETTEQIVREF